MYIYAINRNKNYKETIKRGKRRQKKTTKRKNKMGRSNGVLWCDENKKDELIRNWENNEKRNSN